MNIDPDKLPVAGDGGEDSQQLQSQDVMDINKNNQYSDSKKDSSSSIVNHSRKSLVGVIGDKFGLLLCDREVYCDYCGGAGHQQADCPHDNIDSDDDDDEEDGEYAEDST